MAAATSGQKKTAEFSSFSAALAKSVAPIYISGKPTQTEVVALTPPPSQDKNAERNSLFSFLFFSFSPKKLWNQTSSLKREEKKALNGKRTDEGAEKRKKKKARETRKKYHWRAIIWAISGRLLFHPPVGMEGTGRVCLAAGWRRWRVERQEEGGRKRKRGRSERVHGTSEPKDCPVQRVQQGSVVPEGPSQQEDGAKDGGKRSGRKRGRWNVTFKRQRRDNGGTDAKTRESSVADLLL